jgi:5-methylthioadenosine/S-adenosylhomocysteine deaminase
LKWDKALGSIEKGKRADLAVWSGKSADPYGALIRARESDLRLVLINGVPRYGAVVLMKKLGVAGESTKVGGETRRLFLTQKTASAPVTSISLAEATATLKQAVKDLPNHGKRRSALRSAPKNMLKSRSARGTETWVLALDEVISTGMDLRPHLPFDGESTMATARGSLLSAPALPALTLDPLTVVDDSDFLDTIASEKNLPAFVKDGIKTLY